jgi:tetratricopeptide (TPR) repeat protein
MKRLLVCLLLVGVVGCEKSDADKAEAEFNKGVDFSDREDQATAIACYTEAIRKNPDFAGAYFNRGVTYGRLGNDVKADADFAKAKELGYEFPEDE